MPVLFWKGFSFGFLNMLLCWCHCLISFALESSDEVGFIHPSQFVTLNEETGHFGPSSYSCVLQSADDVSRSKGSDVDASYQVTTMLWSKDHKLGISTHVLLPLYMVAKHAFMDAIRRYKTLNSPYDETRIECSPCTFSSCRNSVESEVMKHSRALLLLSCDFGTAWHSRFCPFLHSWFWATYFLMFLQIMVVKHSPKCLWSSDFLKSLHFHGPNSTCLSVGCW